MQTFSLHTHTLGFDGHNTEEEMIQQAQKLGWTRIGFSNHFIVHPVIKQAPMYEFALKGDYQNIYSATFEEAISKFEPHYQKIDFLRKETNLKILKGMEVDFFPYPGWQEGFEKAVSYLKPDYLIGSTHFVATHGTLYNSHDIKTSSPIEQKELLHQYWQNIQAAAQSGLFTFLAHLDLMKKVGLGKEEFWIQDENTTIKVIQNAGVGVELNTSYFKIGYEPYPSPRIIKMLSLAHIPVIISDDAHMTSQLGNYFKETEHLIQTYRLNKLFLQI